MVQLMIGIRHKDCLLICFYKVCMQACSIGTFGSNKNVYMCRSGRWTPQRNEYNLHTENVYVPAHVLNMCTKNTYMQSMCTEHMYIKKLVQRIHSKHLYSVCSEHEWRTIVQSTQKIRIEHLYSMCVQQYECSGNA